MIVSFINTNQDGLNCFAYSLAMAEHYDKEVVFFMIDDNCFRFVEDLNKQSSLLVKQFSKTFNNNKVHIYEESMLSQVNKDFLKINEIEAVVFASSFLKRYGSLRIFQNMSKLTIPIFNIKKTSIFTPLKHVFKAKDLDLISNQDLLDNLKNNFNIEKSTQANLKSVSDQASEVLNIEKHNENQNQERGGINTTEEIAGNLLLQEFHIANKNLLIYSKKIYPKNLLKCNVVANPNMIWN